MDVTYYYLYIDKSRVLAPIRYDDPRRAYPHLYGALNRDAIVAIREARRDADGKFLPPDALSRNARDLESLENQRRDNAAPEPL